MCPSMRGNLRQRVARSWLHHKNKRVKVCQIAEDLLLLSTSCFVSFSLRYLWKFLFAAESKAKTSSFQLTTPYSKTYKVKAGPYELSGFGQTQLVFALYISCSIFLIKLQKDWWSIVVSVAQIRFFTTAAAVLLFFFPKTSFSSNLAHFERFSTSC